MSLRTLITQKIGVDKAIFYTLAGRGLQMATSVFTVLFIVKFLSLEVQGYYYTFGSIVAIQVFFELGLTTIITQFVAHEVSHIKLEQDNIKENDYYKSRLSSLLHICAKWYCIISFGLLVILSLAGFYFFSRYNHGQNEISWQTPWALLSMGTVMNFLVTPLIAFIEGLGKVKEVAFFRLIQMSIQPLVLWGGLWLGAGLYVLGLDSICRVLIIIILISLSPIKKTLTSIWNEKITDKISYKNEIFPYQWRIAVSWISGYFIFQLFNPVLFATEGPKVAGQMGMTMQALNALQALTLAWINTKIPRLSGYIALRNYADLDKLFVATFKQVISVGFLVLLVFVLVIGYFQEFNIKIIAMDIGNRFLPIIPLMLMAWSVFTMFPINCWAIYLRSHKKEPLMCNSLVMGILCCISTITFGELYGLYGITISFAVLRIISLIWVHWVYKKKKKQWHIES